MSSHGQIRIVVASDGRGRYQAYWEGDAKHVGLGRSPQAAIGELCMQYPALFSVRLDLTGCGGHARWTQPSHTDHQPTREVSSEA